MAVMALLNSPAWSQTPMARINVAKSIWCENQKIDFGNQSVNSDSFVWYMGDGTVYYTKKTKHSYDIDSKLDSFTVSLVAIDKETKQKDSATQLIKVELKATARFEYKTISIVCLLYPKCENFVSLDWDYGDGETDIKYADSITHTYPGSGTYTVKLIAYTDFMCNDTFSEDIVIVDSFESVGETNTYQMTLYPNPSAHSVLRFQTQEKTPLTFFLSDQTGKVIYQQEQTYPIGSHHIELTPLWQGAANGVYYLTLNNGQTSYVMKAYKSE
jgi:hypothetical protein